MIDPTSDAQLLQLISDYRVICSEWEVAKAALEHHRAQVERYELDLARIGKDAKEAEAKVLARLRFPGFATKVIDSTQVELIIRADSGAEG